MAQWDMMVLRSCSILPVDSLARVRVRSSLGLESALCSDCLPSSTDLSQEIECTGVVVPVLIMELVSHPQFSA